MYAVLGYLFPVWNYMTEDKSTLVQVMAYSGNAVLSKLKVFKIYVAIWRY